MLTRLKEALTTAGLITSILYENSSTLIITTPMSNKPVKFYVSTPNYNMILAYTGDGYTSGSNLTNQQGINAYNSAGTGATMIVKGSNVLFMSRDRNNTHYNGAYFTKLSNGDFFVLGITSYSDFGSNNLSYNTTKNESQVLGVLRPITVVDSLGNYQSVPVYVTRTNGSIVLNEDQTPATLGETKQIMFPTLANETPGFTIFGDVCVFSICINAQLAGSGTMLVV